MSLKNLLGGLDRRRRHSVVMQAITWRFQDIREVNLSNEVWKALERVTAGPHKTNLSLLHGDAPSLRDISGTINLECHCQRRRVR